MSAFNVKLLLKQTINAQSRLSDHDRSQLLKRVYHCHLAMTSLHDAVDAHSSTIHYGGVRKLEKQFECSKCAVFAECVHIVA